MLFDKRIGRWGLGLGPQALPDRDQQPTLRESPHRPGLVLVSVAPTALCQDPQAGGSTQSVLRLMHPREKAIGSPNVCQGEKKQVALGAPSPRLTLSRGCSPWGPPARATPLPSHCQAFTPPTLKHRWTPPPCPGVCTCLTAGGPPKEGTVRGRLRLFPLPVLSSGPVPPWPPPLHCTSLPHVT